MWRTSRNSANLQVFYFFTLPLADKIYSRTFACFNFDVRYGIQHHTKIQLSVDTLSYKTISGKRETANKQWLVVDAEGQQLGRLASKVAYLIRGKHKPNFTPHADCGDNVIVVNAEKVALSGNKLYDKKYIRHTGYPGGQRVSTAREIKAKHPERLVEKAVKGMLPKNKLGNRLYRNLKVYAGSTHNQEAQQPKTITIDSVK